MQGCNQKIPLCRCVDWKTSDLIVQVNHLMTRFEFTGFCLEYNTLEPEENRRICKVGQCRTCGQRLCIGTKLPDQVTADDLVEEIYRWIYRMWDGPHGPATGFRETFLSLFHSSDQKFVRDWMIRRGLSIGEGR